VRASVLEIVGGAFGGAGSDRILDLFLQNVPQLAAEPTTRRMIEMLAASFAKSIDASVDSERALNNLDRFLQGVGSRRFYYELLLDRPELVERLTGLFSSSKFLSGYLASHPRLIEPVFADPSVLLLDRDQLVADLAATRADCGDDAEAAHDALRIFQHRQILNVGLLDVADKVGRTEVESSLTQIAEVCLDEALALAHEQLVRSRDGVPPAAERGEYLVIGMGKLGSRELSYGSDLDLIFLYELQPEDVDATAVAQHYFVRLTQRLISVLQTPTSEGACYEIDARLRPSGNQGTLVTSIAAFRRYHDDHAEVWERQALLRARPVAGDVRLAEHFESLRREILQRPLPPDLASEIDRIRQRMEVELAQETGQRRNFKTGRGGILDVETVVQYLQLRNGSAHPDLHDAVRLEVQLGRLAAKGLLGEAERDTLQAGWDFLQALGARLRIVENRSISDLDSERGDLESLALRLGYEPTGRTGGARRALLRDYKHHTEAIRSVYEQILRSPAKDA
jgi:glutamate-ammonia-ligase adenylyltransferase